MSGGEATAVDAVDAVIGIGSNVRAGEHIPLAVSRLAGVGEVVAVSAMHASAPVGRTDQPAFTNGAARVRTRLAPPALKSALRGIEAELGRVRDPADPNGPRTIDLDLVAHGATVSDDPPLPDPDLLRRWFVAVPTAEVWPDWRHPVDGRTAAQIAATFADAT